MKNLLVISLLTILHSPLMGQGDIQFSITVVMNSNSAPASGLQITAMETSTLKTVNVRTNTLGKAELKLTGGKEWAVSVGEMKKCMYLLSEPGKIVATNRFFVYNPQDYKRKKLQDESRSNAGFVVIPQTATEDSDFKPGEGFLAVTLQEPRGNVVPNIQVDLVDIRDSVIYRGHTNHKGQAFFVVPNRRNYEMDVSNIKNYSYCDFGDEYISRSLVLGFAPTIVNEKVVNDTIFQEVNETSRPSSERTLMRIFVEGGKKNGVREPVYMRELIHGTVYASNTNDRGYAYFLVPVKQVYIVDLNYQKNVDAINLTHVNDITTGQKTVRYAPDPRLEYPETFIPTPDRLLVQNFNDFLGKQFTRAKDKPFNLEIKSVLKIHKQSREALFMLTLAGSETYGNVRLPLNAALVLDKSGSMFSNQRTEALKRSLLDIGSALRDTDVVSVILFDDFASEVQHSTSKHMAGLQLIAENYVPGGGTNIFAGLQRGAESIRQNFDPNRSNKIFLLTDGYGDNQPKDITDFVEEKFKQGIEFSTIGLGTDYNQALLELIATKGNGTFSYADSAQLLSEVFLKQIKSSLGYSVKDLKIDIFHHEKLVFSNLFGYPVSGKTDRSVSFEIGKVPHDVNHLAFLKFRINSPSKELENSPLVVKVTYFDLLKKQPVSYQQEISMEWTDETQTELLLDQEEKKLYAIAILTQSMKLMAEAYERKDTKQAMEVLKSGREQIEEIFPEAKPKHVKELFEDVARFMELLNRVAINAR
jgi:hypothetical protein